MRKDMIIVKNLHKKFGDLSVLNGINEHISPGETVRKPLRGDNRILNVGLSPKQS